MLRITVAALLISGAAIFAAGQDRDVKQNTREPAAGKSAAAPEVKKTATETAVEEASYSYEFTKAEFYIHHLVIRHDGRGRGQVSFERQNDPEPIVEPLELSEAALARIQALWEGLRFLDSKTDYQSEKQFPHMGTMRLRMERGGRDRVAEFNWTNDPQAKELVEEYRRVANQTIFVFDITLSRENQPLNSPKLMDQLERYVNNNQLSDPQQLIPLVRDLSTDERLPLMARNHAGRILKKIEKK